MRSRQTGFTLIELIMVIVILGVLSAVAIPKYLDLKSDANQAAVNGVAGSLSSAASVNFATRTANPAKGVQMATCTDVAKGLQTYTEGEYTTALPKGSGGEYVIEEAKLQAGVATNCTLVFVPTSGDKVAATFTALGIN